MRAVIYARYSSNQQRDASIEDQIEVCKRYIDRESWRLVDIYEDRALSGSSAIRPGYQRYRSRQATTSSRRLTQTVTKIRQ